MVNICSHMGFLARRRQCKGLREVIGIWELSDWRGGRCQRPVMMLHHRTHQASALNCWWFDRHYFFPTCIHKRLVDEYVSWRGGSTTIVKHSDYQICWPEASFAVHVSRSTSISHDQQAGCWFFRPWPWLPKVGSADPVASLLETETMVERQQKPVGYRNKRCLVGCCLVLPGVVSWWSRLSFEVWVQTLFSIALFQLIVCSEEPTPTVPSGEKAICSCWLCPGCHYVDRTIKPLLHLNI